MGLGDVLVTHVDHLLFFYILLKHSGTAAISSQLSGQQQALKDGALIITSVHTRRAPRAEQSELPAAN